MAKVPAFPVGLCPILLGYLVLGESISPREMLGAIVIGSGLLVIDGRALNLVSGAPSIPKASR